MFELMALMRNLVCGDCSFQKHFRSHLIISWSSNVWAYAMRRTTPHSIHRLILNSNDTWLSDIVDLTVFARAAYKVVSLAAVFGTLRDIQKTAARETTYKVDVAKIHIGSASPYKSSSASARSSRFRLYCKDFSKISTISNWFTKSTAAHIHRFARFIHLF